MLFVGKNKTIQKYIEIFFIMWRKSIYNENVKEKYDDIFTYLNFNKLSEYNR